MCVGWCSFITLPKILDNALIWWWYILKATQSETQEQATLNLNTNKALKERKALRLADCVSNVLAHSQKPDFVFRRKGRVYLNRRGRQFIRLLAAEVCASAVVMLDTPCSEVVWRVLATDSVRQFRLHFPSRASPYAITFQLESTYNCY